MSNRILVVDDEDSILESVTGILEDEGFEVTTAREGAGALDEMESELPDLVLLDIWMPGMDGLEVLKRIKGQWPTVPVIIMSGHGTIETAVKATKLGAHDFIEKPLSYEQLLLAVRNGLKFRALEEENLLLREQAAPEKELIGDSPPMRRLKEQISLVAPTDAWVLIQGENGTGKELVAQTIHRMSKRSHRPLVEVNCAAIPEDLIESELFGHEKGAFTGATTMKRGKFDQANGGTLFLDEIGDMSLKTQAKILRILQEQRFERVGGNRTINVDVRIIAATNKDLEAEIRRGNFREDLFFRLNVIPMEVPPLRERKEDIPLLVRTFLREFAAKVHQPTRSMTPQALERLKGHDWPGNVRELRNLVERILILSPAREIGVEDLPPPFSSSSPPAGGAAEQEAGWMGCRDFREAKALFEKEYLEKMLRQFQGNVKKTADAIGLASRHLHRKIKELGIDTGE